MKARHSLALGLALAAALPVPWVAPGTNQTTDDPYARSSRSKGEKARNKKYRRG